MAEYYRVKQGDHLSSIASDFGFSNFQTIWNDPNNATLRSQRVNPNVLYPGDKLYIPDIVPAQFDKPTDQMHRFTVNAPKLTLRLVLEDLYEKPIANAACQLQVAGVWSKVTTDAQGQIVQPIPPNAHDATILVQDPQTPTQDITIPIKIGDLDPVDQLSGQVARLENLGYFPGDGTDYAALRSAIEEFQCDSGLTVDGVCGPQTQARLKQVHGC